MRRRHAALSLLALAVVLAPTWALAQPQDLAATFDAYVGRAFEEWTYIAFPGS